MHQSVLTEKVISYLDPKPNQNFIDCTVGAGGHTKAILEKTGPKGKVLGLDLNEEAIVKIRTWSKEKKMGARLYLKEENFAHVTDAAKEERFKLVRGIVLDLGLSSDQLESSGRGFSFKKSEPLDMRYSLKNPVTAEKILNFFSRQDLERIFKEYGEEQFAKEIAEAVVKARAEKHIKRTDQLVAIILQATPRWYQGKKIHAATKTFQALRIEVNRELENLKEVLPQSVDLLEKEGTLVVISFHSLEDRMVKTFFKDNPALTLLTKKPVIASVHEIQDNPRSRSAKLRAARKK